MHATPLRPLNGIHSIFVGLLVSICSWSYCTAILIRQILRELWDFLDFFVYKENVRLLHTTGNYLFPKCFSFLFYVIVLLLKYQLPFYVCIALYGYNEQWLFPFILTLYLLWFMSFILFRVINYMQLIYYLFKYVMKYVCNSTSFAAAGDIWLRVAFLFDLVLSLKGWLCE